MRRTSKRRLVGLSILAMVTSSLPGTASAADQCKAVALQRRNLPERLQLFRLEQSSVAPAGVVLSSALPEQLEVQDCGDPSFFGYDNGKGGFFLLRKTEVYHAEVCSCPRQGERMAGVAAGGTLQRCKKCP